MAIGELRDDATPRVEQHKGKVAVWGSVDDPDDNVIGLLLSAEAAVTAATRMLREVANLRGDALPALQVGNVALDVREAVGEDDLVVRLVFDVEGAPLAATLDLTQLAEITAAMVKVSRDLDKSPGPRHDR